MWSPKDCQNLPVFGHHKEKLVVESLLTVVGCISSFCVKLAVKRRKALRLSFNYTNVNTNSSSQLLL